MRLQTIEPWVIAAAFALAAGLCLQMASLCAHIADLIRLYSLVRPDAAVRDGPRLWRAQRWTYHALAVSCAGAALSFVAIALGWG